MITNNGKNILELDTYAYALILVNNTPDVIGNKNGTAKKNIANTNSILHKFLIDLINFSFINS